MFIVTRERCNQALQPHLETGEQLKSWAYGAEQLSVRKFALLIAVFVLVLAGGTVLLAWLHVGRTGMAVFRAVVIALVLLSVQLIRKDYLVALTTKRLLIVHIRIFAKQIVNWEYPIGRIPPIDFKERRQYRTLRISDSAQPFEAKFSAKAAGIDNRAAIAAIIASLAPSGQKAPGIYR